MKELEGDVSCTVNVAEFGNSVLLLSVCVCVCVCVCVYIYICSSVPRLPEVYTPTPLPIFTILWT